MKNKRLAVGLLVLSVVIAIAAVFYPSLYPPQPAATPANFSRLYIGMERDEVCAVLGTPTHAEEFSATWQTDLCRIKVLFFGLSGDTGDRRATDGTLTTEDGQTLKLQPKSPGVLETVRGWLRW